MAIRLTQSAVNTLDNKSVKTYYSVTINGTACSDVVNYSYSFDRNFGAATLNLTLTNPSSTYTTGAKTLAFGQSVTLVEGIYNDAGTLESFNRFKGIIRQINPESGGSGNLIKVTVLDNICRLQDMDIDKFFESPKTQVYGIPISTTTGGSLLRESVVSTKLTAQFVFNPVNPTTVIYIDDTTGFEDPLTNPNGAVEPSRVCINGTEYTYNAKTATTLTIVTQATDAVTYAIGTYVTQSLSQMTANQSQASFFDFGYWNTTQGESLISNTFTRTSTSGTYWFHAVKNISPTVVPIVVIKPKGAGDEELYKYEDPEFNGFDINYAEGQLVLNTALDTSKYEVWASFYYYPDSTIYYGEDILEDIVTETDGYDNAVFTTATDMTSTLLAETGVSSENLTYNRSIIYYDNDGDGIKETYEPGRVWYMKYSNISTTLVAGNFTLASGKTISYIDHRHGRIFLNSAVATPADGNCTCNVSYTFKTIQATGVKVPFFRAEDKKTQSRFDTIQELKKLLAPNYVIYADGSGKIWGRHIQQEFTEDYELKLKTGMSYSNSADVYTRAKVYGQSGQPYNITLKDAKPPTNYAHASDAYVAFAQNQPLVLEGTITKAGKQWMVFGMPVDIINSLSPSKILTSPPPALWINGSKNRAWAIDDIGGQNWGYITKKVGDDDVYEGLWFHRNIDFTAPIHFWQGDTEWTAGVRTSPLHFFELTDGQVNAIGGWTHFPTWHSSLPLEWDSTEFRWKFYPNKCSWATINRAQWTSTNIKAITSIDFMLDYHTDWEFSASENKFYVSSGVLLGENPVVVGVEGLQSADVLKNRATSWHDVANNIGSAGVDLRIQPANTGLNWYSFGGYTGDGSTAEDHINDGKENINQYWAYRYKGSAVTAAESPKKYFGGNSNTETVNYSWVGIGVRTINDANTLITGFKFSIMGDYGDSAELNGYFGMFNLNYSDMEVYVNTVSDANRVKFNLIYTDRVAEALSYPNSTTLETNVKYYFELERWVHAYRLVFIIKPSRTFNSATGQYVWGKVTTGTISEIDLLSPTMASNITADFYYEKYLEIPRGIERLYDGRWNTSVQSIAYTKPTKGFMYTAFDFTNQDISGKKAIIATTLVGGETTITVDSTKNFPDSGTAYIVTGDRNELTTSFTYTGRTNTTFTGCSGVIAAASGKFIIENVGQAIDAIDITGGWYTPGYRTVPETGENFALRKYDTSARYSIKYNIDGTNNYLPISSNLTNFDLASGETKSFEKSDLGENFRAKRVAIFIEDINPIEGFGPTKWVISLVEFSCWRDIYLTGESKLIKSTAVTVDFNAGSSVVVSVKDGTTIPLNTTCYIVSPGKSVETVFCTARSSTSVTLQTVTGSYEWENTYISLHNPYQEKYTDPNYANILDTEGTLTSIGDRVYKDLEVKTYLNTEKKVKDQARLVLRELSKNIKKASVSVLARPDMLVGDTVKITDSENLANPEIYFIEGISGGSEGAYGLTLAQYSDYYYA